jgi:hypothetical protein
MKHQTGQICPTTPDGEYIERKAGLILSIPGGNLEPIGARQIANPLQNLS